MKAVNMVWRDLIGNREIFIFTGEAHHLSLVLLAYFSRCIMS